MTHSGLEVSIPSDVLMWIFGWKSLHIVIASISKKWKNKMFFCHLSSLLLVCYVLCNTMLCKWWTWPKEAWLWREGGIFYAFEALNVHNNNNTILLFTLFLSNHLSRGWFSTALCIFKWVILILFSTETVPKLFTKVIKHR